MYYGSRRIPGVLDRDAHREPLPLKRTWTLPSEPKP